MKHTITYWARLGASTTIAGIIAAGLLNLSAAFAADISTAERLSVDQGLVKDPGCESSTTADIVGKPSIHDEVIDELKRGEPVSIGNRAMLPMTPDRSVSNIPTSMLWPAYKYIPDTSGAVRT